MRSSFDSCSDDVAIRSAGKSIRRLRQSRGMTLDQLAEASDVTTRTVCNVEQGEPFTMITFIRLCRALGANVNDVLGGGCE